MVNVYDEPAYASTVGLLKSQLAERRAQIGDDGRDYLGVESVVQEFWDYDDAARAKAVAISHAFHAQARAEQEAAARPKPQTAP
jgi:N-acetylglucosamine-6-sulfatase